MKVYLKIYKSAIFAFIALSFSLSLFAQDLDSAQLEQNLFDSLYIEGIREFDKKAGEQNFQIAISALEEATKLRPMNASAHYYLAYAYSGFNRINSFGSSYRDRSLTIRSSEQLQLAIHLQPNFPPKLNLSPYSKITAEWAALALYYLTEKETDSAYWAFQQGFSRGGFSNFMLNIRRMQLDRCPENAILFTKGDDNYWNFLYLQTVEEYRTDVAIIDLGLLSNYWYQQMLIDDFTINFTPSPQSMMDYSIVSWNDTIIEIPISNSGRVFSWLYEARGSNPYYLYAADIAMISIVNQNKFQRPTLFTLGVPQSDYQNLWSEVRDEILLNNIIPMQKNRLSTEDYDTLAVNILNRINYINNDSYDERLQLNSIRRSILNRVYLDWLSTVDADKENAKKLLSLLLKKLPESKYPYLDDETRELMLDFKNVILEEGYSSNYN